MGASTDPTAEAVFTTFDMFVAAFCLAQGHAISLFPVSPTKYKFIFNADAETEAANYYRGATVPARLYANSLRELKSLMNSGRGA